MLAISGPGSDTVENVHTLPALLSQWEHIFPRMHILKTIQMDLATHSAQHSPSINSVLGFPTLTALVHEVPSQDHPYNHGAHAKLTSPFCILY